MGTSGPTAHSAADRVSELVSDRPISSLSHLRRMGAFCGRSRFRFPVLPFMIFRFAFPPGRLSLSDY